MAGACQAYNWLTARCRSDSPAQFAAAPDSEIIIAKGCDAFNWVTMPCRGEGRVEIAAAPKKAITTASACESYNWLTAACHGGSPAQFAAVQNSGITTGSICQSYNWLTANCGNERTALIAAPRRAFTTASISISDNAAIKPRKRDRKEAMKAHRGAEHKRELSHASARRHDPDVATLVLISILASKY
jgi:hypothetical protein